MSFPSNLDVLANGFRTLCSCNIPLDCDPDWCLSNTAIGKQWSPPEVQAVLGHYAELGPQVAAMIPGSTLITFPDLGHAPQLSEPVQFHEELLRWLSID